MTNESEVVFTSTIGGVVSILALIRIQERVGDGPEPPPSTADFSTAIEGTVVAFDASPSTGTVDTYEWDFGDGATGTGQQVTHNYEQEGEASLLSHSL